MRHWHCSCNCPGNGPALYRFTDMLAACRGAVCLLLLLRAESVTARVATPVGVVCPAAVAGCCLQSAGQPAGDHHRHWLQPRVRRCPVCQRRPQAQCCCRGCSSHMTAAAATGCCSSSNRPGNGVGCNKATVHKSTAVFKCVGLSSESLSPLTGGGGTTD